MRPRKAYIVEPNSEATARTWKERGRRIKQILTRIQKKYPKVEVLESSFFPKTEIFNTVVVYIPKSLSVETIGRECSCVLIEVTFTKSKKRKTQRSTAP